MFTILDHYCGVDWQPLRTDGKEFFGIDGVPGIAFQAVALASKPPPYSPHRAAPREDDNVGILAKDEASCRTLFYAPGLGLMQPKLRSIFEASDCLLLDGSFWTDDEMIRAGIGGKRARDMGHLPQSGAGGMIEQLAAFARPRKVLVHINNTNPILDEDSPERAQLSAAGIEVAYDGMRIVV